MTEKMTRLALLTALSLVLFAVESAFPSPIPVPGAKLGLANAVTVWCVYRCGAKEAMMVLAARVLLSSLITGNAFALAFSVSGGFASLLLCAALARALKGLPMWQCSAAGGAMHNAAQLAAAYALTRASGLVHYAPFLLIAGLACGTATGLIAQLTAARLDAAKGVKR